MLNTSDVLINAMIDKKLLATENFALLYSEQIESDIKTILNKSTKRTHPVFMKYFNETKFRQEVAIALALSPKTPQKIINTLIDTQDGEARVALMKRDDLTHNNCYDLLTKTSDTDFFLAFTNPEEGEKINRAIMKNIIDNAILSARNGKELKPYQIKAFSCTKDQALLEKVFTLSQPPEKVLTEIINNPWMTDKSFLDKCFELGCDYKNLNASTNYISDEMYRTTIETISEIQATTTNEKQAQRDATEILMRLIKSDKITTSQRLDLYERIDKMSATDINRSTILKELLKTETDARKLKEILVSTMPILYKRIAATNLNSTIDDVRKYTHKEIENFCNSLPTSVTPYNFISRVIQNTQLKNEDYVRIINKHIGNTKNEKLMNLVSDIAKSKATPITILKMLSDVAILPEAKFIATLNLSCKENIAQKNDFYNLIDICLYDRCYIPNFQYNERIDKILEYVENNSKEDWIKFKAKTTKEKLLESDGKLPITQKEFDKYEKSLFVQIAKECAGSVFTFYQNIDKYRSEYEELLNRKEELKISREELEESR